MTEAQPDIAELAEAARAGDAGAFAQIVRRERMALLSAARAILLDWHEAEDAAQETLVTAWQRLSSLRDVRSFRPWLFRILTRRALRRRSRATPVPAGGDVERLTADTAGEAPDRPALQREMSLLKPKDRVPLGMHHLAGLSLREVAEATGSTEKAVKSRLHRVRARLKRRLEHEDL